MSNWAYCTCGVSIISPYTDEIIIHLVFIAFTTFDGDGRHYIHIPAIKSIYSFPFLSYNLHPSAFTISNAMGEGDVCAICAKAVADLTELYDWSWDFLFFCTIARKCNNFEDIGIEPGRV